MPSLKNTTWTLTAVDHDFNTQTLQFAADNVLKVTFLPSGQHATGTWSEGKHCFSFQAQYSSSAGEEYKLLGSHQGGQGSGWAYVDWSGGTQKSKFTMSKTNA